MTIHTTTEYGIFKQLSGNRPVSQSHKKRLKESMRENYRFTVLTVNEHMEVIDGQHRLECARELGLPVNYVICDGYSLLDVHTINANSKNWNSDDYLSGYCEMGKGAYLYYAAFKKKYGFGHNEVLYLLTGVRSGGSIFDKFKDGELKIANKTEAEYIADSIIRLQKYYDGAKRRAFVFAMITLMKTPEFNFSRFINKLKLNRSMMYDCASSGQYIDLIEQVYNYRSREKVNLRFAKTGDTK